MKTRIVFILISFQIFSLTSFGQGLSYLYFDNISLDHGAQVINCFIQDTQGMIWMGTNNGLYSFDGFTSRAHHTGQIASRIYSMIALNDSIFAVGTDNGLCFYNYHTDHYEPSSLIFPTDIRSLLLHDQTLWIGTLNGLYRYNLVSMLLEHLDNKRYQEIPHQAIYSIIEIDHEIFIGTYNGLCKYITELNRFERISLPSDLKRSNQFVNVLHHDPARNCIWIGMEGQLLQYSLTFETIISHPLFRGNSVKSIALDYDNVLLLGTDNGLYVYPEREADIRHIVHDSRNAHSLSNNIIWSIFSDRQHNIWLGTDYNISLARFTPHIRIIPISQIVSGGDGNIFYAIHKDSYGGFWLGGTNGIIHTTSLGQDDTPVWYRMDNKHHPIFHNRIRHIYEDSDGDVWIATDGSISRFDNITKQFIRYVITDSTRTYNSNWAYHILEDHKGHLWIATCLGGVFVVDKKRLVASGGQYVADQSYTINQGLQGDFVKQIVSDKQENIWMLFYNSGINKINVGNGSISQIVLGEDIHATPNYMIRDTKGDIWAGFNGQVAHINPETEAVKFIHFNTIETSETLTMIEAGEQILISTTDGVWMINKQTYMFERLNIPNNAFTSGFYDSALKTIFLGGNDEAALLSEPWPFEKSSLLTITLTALYVNNLPFTLEQASGLGSIRYASRIDLTHEQNSFIFEFSDFNYALPKDVKYAYMLKPLDVNWNAMSHNTNRIAYSNLEYGSYTLSITQLNAVGQPSEQTFDFAIHITPPWYYTLWSKIVYALLTVAFVVWIVHFFRVKHNLRIERIEKEKTLELSRLKIDFFTNVSHEFKTPLSLIIAPLSRLLMDTKNGVKRQQLENIKQNALKLGTLIRQIIEFNRDDKLNDGLIISKVEMVEFIRSIFFVYKENYENTSLRFVFKSNVDQLYAGLDVIKLESAITNILTNSCKFTKKGVITIELCYRQESKYLQINIEDTGIGIPGRELPFVFERFYKSSNTVNRKEGTGIGLYLVKRYVEQHRGTVTMSSEEGRGTLVTLLLPIIEEEGIKAALPTTGDMVKILPLALIVEDNIEIAEVIRQVISPSFKCEIAYNGRQGLEKCRALIPDLIISDILMPVMDGMEMIRIIKKETPTSTIPVILLTAKDDYNTEMRSIGMNIDSFLPKPFEPQMLLKRAEQLLEKKAELYKQLRVETIVTPQSIEAISSDEKFLTMITTLIEERVDDPELNVNALSLHTGISTKQIYRKTRQITGKSPVEYIRYIRMKKAAMLISRHKFTVSEVMYMVGFSNSSYFSKCFQAYFGKTPRQFSEENR